MSHYKPYPAYRDSGVEWIGEVPEHWVVSPFFTVAKELSRSNKGMIESKVLSLSYGRIIQRPESDNLGLVPESYETYQIVEPGEIVFRLTDLQNDKNSLRSAQVRERGIITSAYLAAKAFNIDETYLAWLMRAYDHCKVFYTLGGGLRQSLKYSDVKRLPVLVPPLAEQYRSVNLINRETGCIDALVAKKTRFVELLKEKRQALITYAVTKGPNPKAKMKDSGVEWIGEVPEHWRISKLKYVSRALIGLTYAPEDVVTDGSGITVLRSSNIQGGQLDMADIVQVRKVVDSELMAQGGDILICSRNGSRALIGKNIQLDERSLGCTFGAFMTVVRGGFNDYLYFVFNSTMFDANSALYMTSTVNQLTISMIDNMEIPLPPETEQATIVAQLRKRLMSLDTLLSKTQLSIDLLKKRRAAFITAAVTGRIDLRESA